MGTAAFGRPASGNERSPCRVESSQTLNLESFSAIPRSFQIGGTLTPTISVADLRSRRADSQLIDVRSPSEFAAAHIPGAVNIPMDQIESRLDDLATAKPIVLICQLGKRARMTAGLLEPCHLQVSVLDGGTKAWIQSGLPLVQSSKTRWSIERQVRLGAGILVLAASAFALVISPHWLFLAAFVGAGLTFAGLTDLCPMAELLERLPWNKTARCTIPNQELSKTCR